jgi:hypothetical protein
MIWWLLKQNPGRQLEAVGIFAWTCGAIPGKLAA